MVPNIKKIKKKLKTTAKIPTKKKSNKKTVISIKKSNSLISDEHCKKWIEEQSKENYFEAVDEEEQEVVSGSEEDSEKNCAKTLAVLKKRGKLFKPKLDLSFECEWKDCKIEIDQIDKYLEHVGNHAASFEDSQDTYKCKWNLCTYSTSDQKSLSRHIHYHGYHTRVKTYGQSLRCHIDLPRCSYDSRARNMIENFDTDFVCHWRKCFQSFNSVNLFFEHVKHHVKYTEWYTNSNNPRKSIQCSWDLCKKTFTYEYRLMEHVRSHSKEKNVACYHCGVMFCSNTKYLDHCKRQLTNNEEYQCNHCFKYYASERILKDHIRFHINCHKCSMCDMTCASLAKLAQHVRYKHLPVKPYKCSLCKFSSVMKTDLDRHKNVHLTDVIQCEEFGCNYTCRSLYVLRRHDMKVHRDGTFIYACHCCDREFDMGLKLSKHLIKVHKFHYPSGHSGFKYFLNVDGYYRLQTTRIESLEVTKQILSSDTDVKPSERTLVTPEIIENPQNKAPEPLQRITSIYDFKVMKKYLTDKSIVIDVEELDEKGIVVKSETIVTKELCFPNS